MNALDSLRSDHDLLDELIDRFEASSDRDDQREIFIRLRESLEKHIELLESTLHPDLQARSQEISSLLKDSNDDHQELRDLCDDLEDALESGSAERVEDRFDELVGAIQDHIDGEESDLFELIEETVASSELDQLAKKIEQARAGSGKREAA